MSFQVKLSRIIKLYR